MLGDIVEFDKWIAKPISEVTAEYANRDKKSSITRHHVSWKKFKDSLSPLSVYCYLKARFGAPNGPVMLFQARNGDNIISWHYVIQTIESEINFWSHSSGLEILMFSDTVPIDDKDRVAFITALKADFARYGVKMGSIKQGLDHWNIFINPFQRLNETLHALVIELENTDLSTPPGLPAQPTDREIHRHVDETHAWVKNTTRAAALGTTLRMLFPVVLESFVNLILYIFKNKSLREDQRLYDNAIRQQIDIRVKSLHMNCEGFKTAIPGDDPRFKAFQSLMNGRNDFLHGNVVPSSMQLEDVYLDKKIKPIFTKDEGIIQRMVPKYLANVSIEDVLKDERAVIDLIELIMENLDEPSFEKFNSIFHVRFPGINVNTKELGVVVSEGFAEGLYAFNKGIEDDPEYQIFTDEDFSFEIYIPSLWRHSRNDDRYTFQPIEIYNPENLIVSTQASPKGKRFFDELVRKGTVLKLNGKSFILISLPFAVLSKSYLYFSADYTRVAKFTYTYEKPESDLEWRSMEQMIRDAEKIIGSFNFIASSEKGKREESARYYAFLRGIATSHYLFTNAVRSNNFFEAAINIKNTVYSILRISIVAFDQLKEKNDNIDLKWIYQKEEGPEITNKSVLVESTSRDIITNEDADKIDQADKKLSFYIEHFVTSGVTQLGIREVAIEFYELSKIVDEKLKSLELEQVREGVGAWKLNKNIDEDFYRRFISAKLGRQAYL